MDTHFWIGFFNIIILDIILSGDNAVVIGMAARNLPPNQRKKAILFGAGAAVLLRASLTAIATYLLKIPLLMTLGGMLLLWIAVKLLLEEEENTHVSTGKSMRSAIKTIVVADVVMSLDNVLAVAGAAHGNIFLVLFGLALSIPIIMWGSRLIATLLNKLPWLVYIGSAILGYTAGQLIVEDPIIEKYLLHGQDTLVTAIPIVLAIVVVVVGVALKKSIANQKTA
ncbi:TerC family protein [Paenactinomyces guangxiensis]|uniref:TerC family protein n=1 Tax=Paenactinomyces guangxiensis TaxID=1490290 RepID=A0A7W1WNU7_9BACL|nr:TerC family protein [Paenactinomyces guangxiensis]MBA4493241.1 TerC family protein [Paenactinomyces guangxiensis]MBH8589909.1 TerC family protein [Paenactinomyces guangxiensis]